MQRTHGGNITPVGDLTISEHVLARTIDVVNHRRGIGRAPHVAGVEHYDTTQDRQSGLLDAPDGSRQSHAVHVAALNPYAAQANRPIFLIRQLHFHSTNGFQGGRWVGEWG